MTRQVLSAHCRPLIVNYLRHIKSVWEYIFNGDLNLMKNLDHASLRILELICPKMSVGDAQKLNVNPIGRHLSKEQQNIVRARVLQIDTLIPTFRSLFSDLNYLEDLVNAIKQLHRPKIRETSLRHSL